MINNLNFPVPGPGIQDSLVWPPMAPGASLPFSLTCTDILAALGTPTSPDTIETVEDLVISPAGSLTGTLKSQTDDVLTWQLSGGTVGITYTLGVSFTTAGGNVLPINCFLPVNALSPINTPFGQIGIVKGPPGEQGTPGTITLNTQTTSLVLGTLPPQSAGFPEFGYWLSDEGVPELAPSTDMTIPTDGNLGACLLALGIV